jgi:hypothetical protein
MVPQRVVDQDAVSDEPARRVDVQLNRRCPDLAEVLRELLRVNAFVPPRVIANEIVDLDSRSVSGTVADPIPVMTVDPVRRVHTTLEVIHALASFLSSTAAARRSNVRSA